MGFPSEIPQGLGMFGWATLTWPGKKWSHAGFPRKFVGKNSYPRKYWQYVDKRAGIFVIKEKSWRILNVIPSYLFELSRDVGPDVLADAGDTWKIFLEWGWERARRVWIHWQRDQRDPWQDQCQGAANPGLGIVPCCAKLSMEFPPVKAETTSAVCWKLRNRLWKIPEFQNSKIPLINSPSPEGAQMLYPNLTNLQAVEFPWSHIFPFQPGDPGSLSLGWSLLLILSLIPSSLELLSFHPKDFFVMQPSLDKEFKWISSKLSSNSLAGKAQLFPVVSSSTALEQDSGSIHQSSLPQGLPDRSSDPPAPVNGIVIAN